MHETAIGSFPLRKVHNQNTTFSFLFFINETTSYFAKILSLAILDHPPKGK
jgi:F0F1-type ATP synthase membrane subunit a